MKIICEYCKNSIDTSKDNKCPNCLASYSDNKMFKEGLEELKKQKDQEYRARELDIEKQKIQNEQVKSILETTKKIFGFQKYIIFIPILFFLLIFFGIIFSIFNSHKDYPKRFTTTTMPNITTTTEKKVAVGLNEFGETSKYKVKIDKTLNIDKIYGVISPSEGKKYKAFHLIVENKTESTLILNAKINCIVDDFVQKESNYHSKYPPLPFKIDSLLKAEGYVIFEVPINAKKYDIKYGDYITIHIDD